MKSLFRKSVVMPIHKCRKKDCGQIFRTAVDRGIHELDMKHCMRCSFGAQYKKEPYCVACGLEIEPFPKERMRVV